MGTWCPRLLGELSGVWTIYIGSELFQIGSVTSRCRIFKNFIVSELVKYFRIFTDYKFLCELHKRPPMILHTKPLKFIPHSGAYYSKLILILLCHILPSTQPLSSLQAFKKGSENKFLWVTEVSRDPPNSSYLFSSN
jgi:hypothetical protein